MGLSWATFMDAGVKKCNELGAKILVVDTAGKFTHMEGEQSNADGAVRQVLDHVSKAQAQGIAVVLSKHERKSDGRITDAWSGSHAWGAEADLLVRITKEDALPKTQRRLEVEGRFDDARGEWTIELDPLTRNFTLLGDFQQVQSSTVRSQIGAIVPLGDTFTVGELCDRLPNIPDGSIRRVLAESSNYAQTGKRGQWEPASLFARYEAEYRASER
jgi:hypothetical protein